MRDTGSMKARTPFLHADRLAPWGDAMPEVGPTAVEDLLTRPDDGRRYEVVEGVLIRVAGSGAWATTIARRLGARLGDYVDARGMGLVTGADGVYRFPGAETGLLPDVGFLASARAARIADLSKPIPYAPDLAVEVASPSQSGDDLAAKALRYLAAGTSLVWIIWPECAEVSVWRPGDTSPSGTLNERDALSGEDVVPGFTCPVEPLLRKPTFGAS